MKTFYVKLDLPADHNPCSSYCTYLGSKGMVLWASCCWWWPSSNSSYTYNFSIMLTFNTFLCKGYPNMFKLCPTAERDKGKTDCGVRGIQIFSFDNMQMCMGPDKTYLSLLYFKWQKKSLPHECRSQHAMIYLTIFSERGHWTACMQ